MYSYLGRRVCSYYGCLVYSYFKRVSYVQLGSAQGWKEGRGRSELGPAVAMIQPLN